MAKVKPFFQTAQQPILLQTDAFEFGDNTAYKTFYGVDPSGAVVLTTQEVYGFTGYTRTNNAAADLDFDFQMNSPLVVEGEAILNYTFAAHNDGSQTAVAYSTTATLYHYDGTTETQLGDSVTWGDTSTLNTGDAFQKLVSFKFTIPKTKFKAGDYIRVNITLPATGTSTYTLLYHDPKNRTFNTGGGSAGGDTVSSQMTLSLPLNTNYL